MQSDHIDLRSQPIAVRLLYAWLCGKRDVLMTQEQIASELAMSRDTVNRSMQVLREMGLVYCYDRGCRRVAHVQVVMTGAGKSEKVQKRIEKIFAPKYRALSASAKLLYICLVQSHKKTLTKQQMSDAWCLSLNTIGKGLSQLQEAGLLRIKMSGHAVSISFAKEKVSQFGTVNRRAQMIALRTVAALIGRSVREQKSCTLENETVNVGSKTAPELQSLGKVLQMIRRLSVSDLEKYRRKLDRYNPQFLQYHLVSLWRFAKRTCQRPFHDFIQRDYSADEMMEIERMLYLRGLGLWPPKEAETVPVPTTESEPEAVKNPTLTKYNLVTRYNKLNHNHTPRGGGERQGSRVPLRESRQSEFCKDRGSPSIGRKPHLWARTLQNSLVQDKGSGPRRGPFRIHTHRQSRWAKALRRFCLRPLLWAVNKGEEDTTVRKP